jgi:murein DD-endopeptidase MepM/ murein hydrolase activator NlpD
MSSLRANAALSALLLPIALALAMPGLASADTLTLSSPVAATCVTDDNAVFTVQEGALRPVRGQFMIFPPGGAAFRPFVSESTDGQPGQLLRMYAWSAEPLDSFTVEIEQVEAGKPGRPAVARSQGFRYGSVKGMEVWMVLLGIPPWDAPGEYTLTLTAVAGHRSYLRLEPFTVDARSFFSERIPLSASLTDLATAEDAQKTKESRILALVLSTPHPDAVFETGALLVPLPGSRRTSGYGDRREYDYSNGTKGYSIHLGADIASPLGTLVPASGRGRVVFASPRILTGITIIIEHLPGLFSVYYHLSAIGVKVGEIVEKGQVIGAVGMTGFATGPHLHWEVEDLGTPVDPDAAASAPLLDKADDFFDIGGASGTEGR